MDDLNIDWQAAATAENATMIATGRDAEFTAVFYIGKVPNFEGTDYSEVPHLRLQSPGNQKTIYDQPVRMDSFPDRPSDPERFPQAWLAFKRGENLSGTGTPLESWEGVTMGDVRRLDMLGIHSVEQLALVADSHLDGLGFGGRIIREKARQHVSGRAQHDPEKALLKGQVEKLTDIVQSLLERLGEPAVLEQPGDETVSPPARSPRARAQQQEAVNA